MAHAMPFGSGTRSPTAAYARPWWAAFDAVLCITLQGREDRRARAEATFRQLGVPVRFFVARPHPLGGRVGCFDSHVRVARACLEAGCRLVLVFEDDVRPAPGYSAATLRRVCAFLEAPKILPVGGGVPQWDAVLLGFSVITGTDGRMGLTEFMTYVSAPAVALPPGKDAADLVRYRGVCSHAYCLNAQSMARIVARGEPVLRDARRLGARFPHLDIWYHSVLPRMLCVVPLQFDQRWCSGSDNVSASLTESVGRWLLCVGEHAELLHRLALLRRPRRLAVLVCAVFALLLLLLLVLCLLAARRPAWRGKKKTRPG
jgi:hypothetical protein